VNLSEHTLVFLDVFKNIEGSDDVKLALIWDLARIHLQKIRLHHALCCEWQARTQYLTAGNTNVWKR